VEARDPIDRYERFLAAEGTASREDLDAVGREVAAYLEAEVDAALDSPLPAGETALESVYAFPERAEDFLAPYREKEGTS
jgi:TPP-dependent pyruvate/acetoin dehydrogenase alpha subunit